MSDNKSELARKTVKMSVPSDSDLAIIQRQRSIQERIDREYEHQINDADERMIPYRELVSYPEDWIKRSELRDRATREQRLPIGQ